MKNILFVCWGNICRSPAAEGIFKYILEYHKRSDLHIDSAGIIDHHAGEKPDSRMVAHSKKRGYDLNSYSRPILKQDFLTFDLILAMDDLVFQSLIEIDSVNSNKVKKMADYLTKSSYKEIPDPYYSGASGFELVLDLLEDSCSNLYKQIDEH